MSRLALGGSRVGALPLARNASEGEASQTRAIDARWLQLPNEPRGLTAALGRTRAASTGTAAGQGAFDDEDFVKSLTKPLMIELEAGRLSDPKRMPNAPFLSSFVAFEQELGKSANEVHEEIRRLEAQCEQATTVYQSRLSGLQKFNKEITENFGKLETPFTSVGQQAVRIGEQLGDLDRQRLQALEASRLLRYFIEFHTGSLSAVFTDERLTHEEPRAYGERHGRRQAAVIAKRLQMIAADAESATTAQAKTRIDAYCVRVEEILLKQLENATAEDDLATMRRCAQTLYDFNGGKAATAQYIQRHPLVVKDRTVAMRRMNEQWFNRSHNLPALLAVCSEVKSTCEAEKDRLDQVFPNAGAVLAQLGCTLVRAHVVPYVATLLSITVKGVLRDHDDKTLKFLPTLAAAHQAATALFDDLQPYNVDGWLDMKLLQDECFGPYMHRGAYSDEECGHLQASYLEMLTPFMRFKASRKSQAKARTGFGWSAAAAPAAEPAGSAASSNFSVDETLSVELALEMIHEHGHAIARAKQMCSTIELPELVSRLFKIQLNMLGSTYIEAALDITLEQLAAARDSKAPPPLSTVLDAVQSASSIVHLMQKHFQQDVLPSLLLSAAAHRETMLAKNRVLATLEVLINSCLDFLLYGIMQAFTRILAKQKKADYRPKDMAPATASAPVCQECLVYLHKIYTVAKKCLDGTNLQAFAHELGLGLHRLWMDHIRKFTFNNAGGLQLARELTELQHSVRVFGIPDLNQKYDVLRQLANVFVVRPDNLKMLLSEGPLSTVDRSVVLPYIALRADYRSDRINLYFDDGGSAEQPSAADDRV